MMPTTGGVDKLKLLCKATEGGGGRNLEGFGEPRKAYVVPGLSSEKVELFFSVVFGHFH